MFIAVGDVVGYDDTYSLNSMIIKTMDLFAISYLQTCLSARLFRSSFIELLFASTV